MCKQLRLVAIIFLVGVSFPAFVDAQSSPPPQFSATLLEMGRLHRQRQWQGVLSRGQRILRASYHHPSAKKYAKLFMFMGVAFYEKKHKALAWKSFQRALEIEPKSTLPLPVSPKVRKFLAKLKKKMFGKPVPKRKVAPKPAPTKKVHPGILLGWTLAVVTGVAAGAGLAAGLSAKNDADGAADSLAKARLNRISQVSTTVLVTGLHDRAKSYATISNISLIVGGVTALGSAGMFIWARMAKGSANKKTASVAPRANSSYAVTFTKNIR